MTDLIIIIIIIRFVVKGCGVNWFCGGIWIWCILKILYPHKEHVRSQGWVREKRDLRAGRKFPIALSGKLPHSPTLMIEFIGTRYLSASTWNLEAEISDRHTT